MKKVWRLSWSYALTVSLFVIAWSSILLMIIIPRINKIVEEVSTKSFL